MNNNQIVKMKKPLVSICCLTFNMEDYIKQTLESFLMQNTSFFFEVIIHDDASSDNTRSIIEEYALKYPDIIKTVFQKVNQHSKRGFCFQYIDVFPKAQGKYIAFCDGDDYWIDPLKLQKQIDFLESHLEYGIVHTKALKYNDKRVAFENIVGFKFNDFEELITECTVVHSSTCYRNSLMKQYIEEVRPEERIEWTTNDFPVWLWFIQHSKVKFLEDITTVYRQRGKSISHLPDDHKRLYFSEGVYNVVDYFLSENPNVRNENKIRARYYSNMISNYFLIRRWDGIQQSAQIFYSANDWLNLFWIAITLPFSFSRFMIKGSYKVRSLLFNMLNIYPIKK